MRYLLTLLLVPCVLLGFSPDANAESYKRHFRWSGYSWKVRTTHQRENPGANFWGYSKGNVQVQRNGSLKLGIVRDSQARSVEIVSTSRFGYGRYQWVVNSDLSSIDPYVAAFFLMGFTRVHHEADFEFGKWSPNDLPGWMVSWSPTRVYESFAVSSAPPYTLTIGWYKNRRTYFLQDSTELIVYSKTVRVKKSTPYVSPRMSLWINRDDLLTTPSISVRSFKFTRR